MKSFSLMMSELREAKFKLPRGHKELKRDNIKDKGKVFEIIYTEHRGKVHVYVDGRNFSGGAPYKDLPSAEKEIKAVKGLIRDMMQEGIELEEILDEINIRV